MTREVEHILADVLETIERLQTVTQDVTLPDFEKNWQLRFIVQRGIEIISEASRAIPPELKSLRPEIPWNSIRDIGNVLRHQYQGISDPLIWRVVTDELPRLHDAILALRHASRRDPRL
jgi:uncharacterized protein with HEPN domain